MTRIKTPDFWGDWQRLFDRSRQTKPSKTPM
jgi:hypothetical protein